MRSLLFTLAAAALAITGCQSAGKKSDASLTSAQPAPQSPAVDSKKSADAAVTAKGEITTKVQCSVKGDERVLEVRVKGKGCELAYSKFGNEGIVANANSGQEYCEKTLEKMREKLSGSGYDCK